MSTEIREDPVEEKPAEGFTVTAPLDESRAALEAARATALAKLNAHANVKDSLDWEQQDPLNHVPHGDRYLVRVLGVDDVIRLPSGATIWRPEKAIYERGYVPAVIIHGGDGHRLDTPDKFVPMQISATSDAVKNNPYIIHWDDETGWAIMRCESRVPMKFVRAQVVAIPRATGIEIELRGKMYRIVNQSEILWLYAGLRGEVP